MVRMYVLVSSRDGTRALTLRIDDASCIIPYVRMVLAFAEGKEQEPATSCREGERYHIRSTTMYDIILILRFVLGTS